MSSDTGLLAPVWAGTRAAAATCDESWLHAMLAAEIALAAAQERLGTVPDGTAALIAAARPDVADLARRARQAANPVVPLVEDLRRVTEHAHHGATSQDILDSAAMLVARRVVDLVLADLDAVTGLLANLARTHRDTLMAARTLGQQAVATTFGLKAAGWLAGVLHARDRLRALDLPAQLGGAAGTLAALGGTAAITGSVPGGAGRDSLVELYAAELGLAVPSVPWHADRSVVTELGAALAGTAGALGKIATDVILLAQTEVGEVAESSGGRSSAMPHKRNPALSILIRSAALQVPVLAQVPAMAQLGEHERAAGAWQAEWQPLRECLRLTGGAAETAVELLSGLRIVPDRMRANAELGLPRPIDVGAASALIDRVLERR